MARYEVGAIYSSVSGGTPEHQKKQIAALNDLGFDDEEIKKCIL